jgi:hypothetical protein
MPKLFNAKKIALKLGVLTLVAVCGGPAESSSNPPLYTLDWAAKASGLPTAPVAALIRAGLRS